MASGRAVDAGIVRELVQRYAAAGLHGAYTTGTDGEVHVMEVDELKQLAAPFAERRRRRRIAGAGRMRMVAHQRRDRARPRSLASTASGSFKSPCRPGFR